MKFTAKKSCLAAAVATMALASHAEGLYTYALIDGGIASTRITGAAPTASKTEFVTGGYAPTFVGLTYEKAAEGGLTVGGKLEQGFLIAPPSGSGSRYWFGNGDLFNREANIYIKSDYGTFVAGTQPNFAFKTVLLGEPRSGSNYGSALAMIDIAGGLSTVDDAALSYTSNAINGVTLAAQYVPETKSQISGGYNVKTGTRLTASYSQGPLSAGVAVYDSTIFADATSTPATTKASGTIASGAYKLGDFTLKGIYAGQKTASGAASLNTTGFGGSYALTAKTTLDAGLYSTTQSGGSLKVNTTGLGVQQKLTKTLTLYGQYAKVDNKSSAANSGFINFAGPTVLTDALAKGQSANTLNIGLLLALF
jgi:hypothetical protein